jgi:hypothetical protein
MVAAPATAQVPDRDRPLVIEVVPVIAVADGEPAGRALPDWIDGFPAWAQSFWRQTSGGAVALEVRMSEPIPWRRCPTCLVDPQDHETMLPWLATASDRWGRSQQSTDAYLFLLPPGTLPGAGFYLPPEWIVAQFGLPGFTAMAADSPQAALHEMGHALGLVDRYDPHAAYGRRVLTLMGWINDPIAPLDPEQRAQQGWAPVETWILTEASSRRITPDTVLRIEVPGATLWASLQPIPTSTRPGGWLLEINLGNRFERLFQRLLGPNESAVGTWTWGAERGELRLAWTFSPDPADLILRGEFVAASTMAAAPPSGCALATRGVALSALIAGLAGLLLRLRRNPLLQ